MSQRDEVARKANGSLTSDLLVVVVSHVHQLHLVFLQGNDGLDRGEGQWVRGEEEKKEGKEGREHQSMNLIYLTS